MARRKRVIQTGSSYHGAIQRNLNRFLGVLLANPVAPPTPVKRDVVFKGRSRHDTNRALLKYWSTTESHTGMELDEFRRRCTRTPDEAVVFRARV